MGESTKDVDESLLAEKGVHARSKRRKPPIDRGWAWVVMTVCFCNYFILVGLLVSGGIFFVEFLLLYQASTSTTAVISGVLALSISTATFVSQNILLCFVHVRTIVMCGGLVASTGIILASFANNIVTTIVSYSVLTGFGVGMVLIPELVLLGRYFHKRRSIATAVAMVGVNAGGMVMPMLITFLIDEYSLRGALLIYGGIMLNTIVFGALLRPLDLHLYDTSESEDSTNDTLSTEKGSSSFEENVEKKNIFANSHEKEDISINDKKEFLLIIHDKKNEFTKSNDKENMFLNGHAKTDIFESTQGKKDSFRNDYYKEQVLTNALVKTNSLKVPISVSTRSIDNNEYESYGRNSNKFETLIPPMRHRTFSESHKPNSNSKQSQSSNIANLHFASTPNIICMSLPSLNQFVVVEEEERNQEPNENRSVVKSRLQRALHVLDCSLFCNPLFLLLVVTSLFGILVAAVPTAYVPALAVTRGISKKSAPVLVAAASASGIVSRLLVGLFADSGCMRKHVILIICLILTGVTFFLVTVVNDLTWLIVFSASYGFFGSIYFSLWPVILVDFLGLEKLATCYGFIEFFQGASLAASHPFIGWMRDATGNYDMSYHFLGVASFVSAFFLSLEPIARRLQENRKKT